MEKISLQKKLDAISDQPELVQMVNQSVISLQKHNIDVEHHVAKVALCVDLSGSMHGLLRSGAVSEIIKRAVAQGIVFDDDGDIDVFGFGDTAKYFGTTDAKELNSFSSSFKETRTLGGTRYARAIDMIAEHYEKEGFEYPTYVIFVTDGDATDKSLATAAIKRVSNLPIFFQFVGIGGCDYVPGEGEEANKKEKKGFFSRLFGGSDSSNDAPQSNQEKRARSIFGFIMDLDEMEGRHIDNAGFFAVAKPHQMEAKRMFELLNIEYPQWYQEAKKRNMF